MELGVFKNAEEMAKFVADAQNAIKNCAGQAEKLEKQELLIQQLHAGLDEMRKSDLNRSGYTPSGSDAEVERAYANPRGNREDYAPGAVADLREMGKKGWRPVNTNTDNVTHVGSGSGTVRLLGSTDEAGFYEHGLLDDPEPKSQWQHDLQRRFEALAWVRAVKGPRADTRRHWAGIRRHLSKGPALIARVLADNAGEGGEFVVSIPMAQLERTLMLNRGLEAAIPEMQVSSNTATHPFLTTEIQPFLHNVPSAGDLNPAELPKTVPVTAERTINIKTLTVALPADMDAIEDSIVDFSPLAAELVARALVDGSEDCLINGDTAATHGDTAFLTWNPRARWQVLGSSLDHRKGWIGFRQRAFDVDATVTTAVEDYNATQTVSAYLGALAGLSTPHGFGNVIMITSPEHFIKKILTDTNVLTVDKYGTLATLITGEVGKIGGRRLLLSEFMTADLATSGLYTGTGSTTGLLQVNIDRFRIARRRSMRVNVETSYLRNTSYVIASERKTLHTFDSNSIANVHYLYNLTA